MIKRRIHLIFILFFLVFQTSAQKLVVGITENEPLKSYNKNNGEASGVFIDLLDYIAKEEGWEILYKSVEFQEGLDALKNGEIDIIPDLGYSETRSLDYFFTNEDVILSWGQVYTHNESFINNLIDLKNKKIAIVKNNVFDDGFVELAANFNLNCKYIFAKDYNHVFELIENKEVDAGIANRIFGDYNYLNYNVSRTSVIFSPLHLYFAFPKNDKYLHIIAKIDNHLKKLKEDNNSIYYQVINDYFNLKEVNVIPKNFKIFVIVVIAMLLATILFIYSLKAAVRRKTDELKKALTKAQESDHLKSVFLRNLSHEIRTPMNGINGFSLLLKEKELEESVRNRYIDLVISSSRQLLSIVDNIIYVSLIETGQERIKISQVCINDFLEDIHDMFDKSLDEKNIKFDIHKSLGNKESIIDTDQTKLRQILSNLVGNAVKFTSSGYIKFGYTLKHDMLEFFVEDTGIGIDMSLNEQIFKMFSQEDNSRNRRYEGIGLGLSIAKAYTEMLGGDIRFKSEKGVGTTFYFTIPYTISSIK